MKRVVITGLGVVSPIGSNIVDFTHSIRAGASGIKFIPQLAEKEFRCQVGGIPVLKPEQFDLLEKYELALTSNYLKYAFIAGIEAWMDARLEIPAADDRHVFYDAGSIIGTGFAGIDLIAERLVPAINSNKLRQLRSNIVEQMMLNSPTTHFTRTLALGNVNFTNSNACSTGTDAILMAYDLIRTGRAKIMLCGGADCESYYYWGLFDLMRILSPNFNDQPEKASRPMSVSACGFVPGAGAGILVLEELESALERNARIYAEIAGGYMNTGGQRNGGSMTAPNSNAINICIEKAVENSGIAADEVELISGHLTATKADVIEVNNWKKALKRSYQNFPFINSLKSMTGHLLGGAGSLETIATIIQLHDGFIHPNINCEDLHPAISEIIDPACVPQTLVQKKINCAIKASFGFGDVNSCIVLKKHINQTFKT